MKKFAAVLAALMVLSCGTVVLAAPSTVTEDTAKSVVVTTADGKSVATAEVSTEVANEADKVADQKAADSTVLAIVDIKYEGTIPAEGVKLTIAVDGVKAGDNIYLLHQKADKTWEVIHPDKVEDGKVTATFKSLSPVAVVKIADGATLPKTGAPVVLPVMALVCAAGTAVCARKVKFN